MGVKEFGGLLHRLHDLIFGEEDILHLLVGMPIRPCIRRLRGGIFRVAPLQAAHDVLHSVRLFVHEDGQAREVRLLCLAYVDASVLGLLESIRSPARPALQSPGVSVV